MIIYSSYQTLSIGNNFLKSTLCISGRGKKNNWVERLVPLFILPFLIQSGIFPVCHFAVAPMILCWYLFYCSNCSIYCADNKIVIAQVTVCRKNRTDFILTGCFPEYGQNKSSRWRRWNAILLERGGRR